ncbi:MAG: hypothetical protein ABFC84_13645 [Veillonellales bacterium]
MADFSKSGCCGCSEKKSCKQSFTEFASELCPKSKDAKRPDKR